MSQGRKVRARGREGARRGRELRRRATSRDEGARPPSEDARQREVRVKARGIAARCARLRRGRGREVKVRLGRQGREPLESDHSRVVEKQEANRSKESVWERVSKPLERG